jgi:hypothetical protein
MASPPPPPEVTQQQNPNQVSQFVSGYQQPGAEQPPAAPKELVKQKMQQVAEGLRDVARVLATTDPSLMPILKRMVEAGSMLMQQIEQNQQGQNTGQSSVPRTPPEQAGGTPQPEGANPGMG